MAFVPAPNIIQVELRASKALVNVENRWFINTFHEPTAADMLAIAIAINPQIVADWLPLLPTDLVFREMHQRSLHTANGIERSDAFSPLNVGTAAGEPLPNSNTICASLRSLFSGRSARGRLYWMGLTIDQVTTNQVNALVLNDIQDAIRNTRNAISALGFQWTLVSFISNGVPRPGGPVYFIMQDAIFVDARVDSQRGRME